LAVAHDITARKLAEEKVRRNEHDLQIALKEKTSLLNEVHHRVKNNLQVITSLLRLEAGRSDHLVVKTVLADMQGRIRSMALLHETLYRSGIFASADLAHYLRELAIQAFRAQAGGGAAIELKLDLTPVMVSMDKATPCGLLVNELISNCLKHGFPDGRNGEVMLTLKLLPDTQQAHLTVSDNGVGLPVDFEAKREASLGLQLAADLARQIGGELEIGSGSMFSVVFPVSDV
jgi:two-component sensor histidine kinase